MLVVFKKWVIRNLRDDSKEYPNWRWLEATQSADISVTFAREATRRAGRVGGAQRGAAEHSRCSGVVGTVAAPGRGAQAGLYA